MSLTRAQLLTEVAASIADNATGAITPAIFRALLNDILNNVWTLQDAQSFGGALTLPAGSIFSGLSGVLFGNGGSPVTALAAGQIPGTAANDAASSGNLGEYLTATGSGIGLSNGVAANITSLALSAGDWDVWGSLAFTAAATTTISGFQGGTATTSGALPSAPNGGYVSSVQTYATGSINAFSISQDRYSLSGPTTVYLVGFSFFAVSTMTAAGKLSARRRR